ncbi:signal peptide peptidase SppA [Sphingomonas oleivorans]|uniref:Signal peptide peptidase SppA n=1 Tax=Sphingomonas oleivorans TaxID=1735121 RepID=A0A2T5FXS2_9SPHN|nr:signal peptide peptidase SppA [Sphingomonas oleivorans]PTQ10933.1 signal peptide peptidase SppA [Sphingomonas oleivorans]
MRVLRGVWKLLVGIKDGLVLVMMLLFFGLLFAALSATPNPSVPASGALLLKFDGALVEQPADADPLSLLSGSSPEQREYRLRDVTRSLRAAATDARVKAVVLDLDGFAGGRPATIDEAAQAVDIVRRAGKPVLAYATGYSDDGYQLAAHASEIWLDPFGAVLISGPGGSQLYYKGLLDKLGVETKVYRVGQFKSAVEPFTRTDQSPEARAANQALADSLWASWRQGVATARPQARLAAYVADPAAAITAAKGDIAGAALAAGLVDRIGDRIAFGRRVASLAGAGDLRQPGSFRSIALSNWASANPEKSSGDAIGVLTVAGTIVDGEAPAGSAGGDSIARLLLDELAKNRIKALVVRVDSPGGSVTGSERIRSAILQAKARKLPVIVSMGGLAASGGYWVSTPADRIFAEPSTITGSIGVFGLLPNFRGTLDKLGLSADGVKTTPLSGEPDLLRGTSPLFDALMQRGVENMYRRFTSLVAQSRKMPVARVDEIGQGRVWAGGTARQIGLVDQFGTLDDAIDEAARRAGLDRANVRPIFIERQPSFLKQQLRELLAGPSRETSDASARDPWTHLARRPEALLAQALGDARSIAAGPAIQVRCLECPAAAPVPTSGTRTLAGLIAARLGL